MPGHHEDLKRAIRSARHEAGFESDMALSIAAGVHLQTIQNWMYGKTTPRPHEMSKVAAALDKPMDYFMSIYEGREPERQALEDVVAELVSAVRDLIDEMRADRASRADIERAVREGDERDRARRGLGGPSTPVPLPRR